MKAIIVLIITLPFFILGILFGIAKLGFNGGLELFDNYSDKVASKKKERFHG